MTMFPKPKDVKKEKRPGLEVVWSKADRCFKEFCRTESAKRARRWELFERAKGHCERCGLRVNFNYPSSWKNSMHWHHKKLRSRGGDDSMANGECLCRDCHLVGEHGHF
jgi:hypothetical protein